MLVCGVFMFGGSINSLGQWLIETFPGFARIEEMVTPKDLGQEILQRGARQP